MSRSLGWVPKSVLGLSSRWYSRKRRSQDRKNARAVEAVEERICLTADFTASFGEVFAGNADNVVTVNLTSSPTGEVNAWMDFDGDGEFHGVQEQILTSVQLVQGNNELVFEVPFGSTEGLRDIRLTVSTPDPDVETLDTTAEIEVAAVEVVATTPELIRNLGFFSAMDSADYDGDGDVDIFATNINGTEIHYYRNLGDGQFTTFAPSIDLSGSAQEIDSADLNGDGLLDAIVSTSSSAAIDLFIQGPVGHFTYIEQTSIEGADHAAVADFNADGHLDIITIAGDAQLLLNDGTGSFTASTIDTTHSPDTLAVGDVDQDGDTDAIISDGNEVVLYENDGTGMLSTVNDYLALSDFLGTIAILDFNADGLLDIVGAGRFSSDNAVWFENDGAGSYTEFSLDIEGFRDEVEFGDLNGDGFIDAITASTLDGAEFWLNNGDNSTFTSTTLGSDLADFVDAADFDGDGDLDFVFNQGSDVVISFNDGESGRIEIDISADSAIEGTGTVAATVTRPVGSSDAADLEVALASNNARADVPATVTIPAGSDSAPFSVTVLDDGVINGDALAGITASATGVLNGTSAILVIDNDGASGFTASFDDAFTGEADNIVSVELPGAAVGTVTAWIDFDGNGEFIGTERVLTNVSLEQGTNQLHFEVPFQTAEAMRDARVTVMVPGSAAETINSTVTIDVRQIVPELTTSEELEFNLGPSGLAAADFDNDGDVDFFGSNITGSEIFYYQNTGDGRFSRIDTSADLSGSVQEYDVADLNGDGLLDVVASVSTGDDVIDLFIQGPAGHFTFAPIASIEDADHAEIADFDGDGDLDIITISQDTQLLLNDGTGSFTASTIDTTQSFPNNLAVGDVDMDGDVDAVVSNGSEIVLYRNDGAASFTTVDNYIVPSESLDHIEILDFDLDGLTDIVSDRFILGEMYLFKFDGAGYTEITLGIDGGQEDVEFGDFDGDGDTDVITAQVTDGTEVWLNSGDDLTFERVTIHTELSEHVEVADFDNDGDLDLVYEQGNELVWTINNGSGALGVDVSLPSVVEDVGTVDVIITRGQGASTDSDLVVTLTSSDPSRATVPATVTIPADSNSVTTDVTVIDDNVLTGNVTVTISATANASLDGSDDFLIIDDDGQGITIGETGASTSVSETGTSDSFTAVLDVQPQSDVFLNITSGDTGEGSVNIATLTYTPANWDVPQTVTVTGQDDLLVDGTQTFDIQLTVDASSDSDWTDLDPVNVGVTNADDEIASITLMESNSSTDVQEARTTDTFTVVLDAVPEGDVVLNLASNDSGEVTVSPSTLTFTNSSWNTAQTVTVTGVDDVIVDGFQLSNIEITSSTNGWTGIFSTVEVTTSDDDLASFTVTPSSSAEVTEAGSTDGFEVVLNAAPVNEVFIRSTSADTSELAINISLITFDGSNWNIPQTITVSGIDDLIVDGDETTNVSVTVDPTSDAAWIDLAEQSTDFTTIDDDIAGVTVIESGGSTVVNESGTTDTFDVVLSRGPLEDVVVTLLGSDPSESTIDVTSLTFTPENWDQSQTVTVASVDDLIIDGTLASTISMTTESADANFDNLADTPVVNALTTDDDQGGFTIVETDGDTSVAEGSGTDTLSIVLNRGPLTNVILDVAALTGETTIAPAVLTFTPTDWNTPQDITITGVDDAFVDGDTTDTIRFSVNSASDAAYQNLDNQSVSVDVLDDDLAAFVLAESDGDTKVSEQGTTDTFTIVLDRGPETGVVMTITPLDSSEVDVFPITIRFTNRNWDIPQTITVSGVDDNLEDGTILSDVIITIEDAGSDAAFADVEDQSITVTNFDNDGSSFFDNDRLVLNLTPNDDIVTLTDNGDFVDVNINGAVEQFNQDDFEKFRIIADTGNDLIDASGTAKPVFARLMGGDDEFRGGSGNDTIRGGGGRDTLIGNGGDDNLSTGTARDEIYGNDGNDRLRGGNGRDVLEGDAGQDTVSGGGGPDVINGGTENDQLTGGSGADTIDGGDGNDTLIGGQTGDSLIAGAGNDIVHGEGGADTISGGDGSDLLIGNGGSDEISGDAGEDILHGGTTDETLTAEQLASVLAEWTSDRSYAQRVSNIRGAADRSADRLNTVFLAGSSGPEAQTMFDDTDTDIINGNGADDMFFAALNDSLTDRLAAEWLEAL